MFAHLEWLHLAVEERVNLKRVHRRLQSLAKLLIVATFVEDALRVLTTFAVQQRSMEIAGWKSQALHTLLPLLSLFLQPAATLLVVLPSKTRRPEVGCYLLLGWCSWHPLMYGQQGNWEFVMETATIMGGLLILLSHFMLLRPGVACTGGLLPRANNASSLVAQVQQRAAKLQAFGRVLIVSIFVYIAGDKAHSWAVQRSFGPNDGPGVWGWGTRLLELGISLALLYLCSLVVIGMKSRSIALLLACIMALTAFYMHPFWIYLLSDREYVMEGVAGMEGIKVSAFTMADHQRYFFFQSMSTVGALLLLVVHGPGKLSVDEPDGPMKLSSVKADT